MYDPNEDTMTRIDRLRRRENKNRVREKSSGFFSEKNGRVYIHVDFTQSTFSVFVCEHKWAYFCLAFKQGRDVE